MDASPIYRLPQDTLHYIFSTLPLRQIIICRSVCKFFLPNPDRAGLHGTYLHPTTSQPDRPPSTSPSSPPPHHHHNRDVSSHNALHVFDPSSNQWVRFPLSFLPFRSPTPVASSLGLVYLWADSLNSLESNKSLIVCNPLTRSFQVLPQLGSAWSRHGSVLVGSPNRVLVLTELATLYFSGSDQWLKFSSNLPSKPRSPILVSDSVLALCDVGSPWRSQWKLFACTLNHLQKSQPWTRLDRHEWGDVFDILRRPRLVKGLGNQILMVGGLKSSFSLNAVCSTILIFEVGFGLTGVGRRKGLGGWHCGIIPQRRGREIGGGSMGCLEMEMACFGVLCSRLGSLHCLDRVSFRREWSEMGGEEWSEIGEINGLHEELAPYQGETNQSCAEKSPFEEFIAEILIDGKSCIEASNNKYSKEGKSTGGANPLSSSRGKRCWFAVEAKDL
ncbi:SKP1-interacting partner 15 [Vitis vinifera]|uniref:SKP1-interacting partner 15 n=1 Tax=Vitis vinifera TaxID=29760 RepID=A0A438ICN3_VITVI|nr:SKP1-interacting partner 15 [Vitis vinifera]